MSQPVPLQSPKLLSAPYCEVCGQLKKWATATSQYGPPPDIQPYPFGTSEKYCTNCGALCPYWPLIQLSSANNISEAAYPTSTVPNIHASSSTPSLSHATQKSTELSLGPLQQPFSTYNAYEEVIKAAYRPTSRLVVGKGIPPCRGQNRHPNLIVPAPTTIVGNKPPKVFE